MEKIFEKLIGLTDRIASVEHVQRWRNAACTEKLWWCSRTRASCTKRLPSCSRS